MLVILDVLLCLNHRARAKHFLRVHIQASMQPLRTPGIQAFLHAVPLVAALWFLFDVEPLTGPVLKGVLPSTSIAGLQARHQLPLHP